MLKFPKKSSEAVKGDINVKAVQLKEISEEI